MLWHFTIIERYVAFFALLSFLLLLVVVDAVITDVLAVAVFHDVHVPHDRQSSVMKSHKCYTRTFNAVFFKVWTWTRRIGSQCASEFCYHIATYSEFFLNFFKCKQFILTMCHQNTIIQLFRWDTFFSPPLSSRFTCASSSFSRLYPFSSHLG